MKIRRVHVHRFSIPLRSPFRIAIGELREAPEVLVRLECDDGAIGLGEAGPFPVLTGETQATTLALARELAPLCLGRDPRELEPLLRALHAAAPGNPSLLAAFDLALHDLAARAAGEPLWRFLGGSGAPLETDQTVPIAEPHAMLVAARAALAAGFRALKIKIGGKPLAEDLELVARLREALGPKVLLRLDANQAWDVPTAREALRALAPFSPQFVEQPVPRADKRGLALLRREGAVPLMADESCFDAQDALELARLEAADLWNVKLMKAGGIRAALRILRIAEAAGIRCMVGCMLESRIAITAAACVAAASSAVAFQDLDGCTFHGVDPCRGGVRAEGALLHLPAMPGLGVEVDPAFLASCETFLIA